MTGDTHVARRLETLWEALGALTTRDHGPLLKAHAKAAHTLEYQAKVKDLIESRTIHVLSPA